MIETLSGKLVYKLPTYILLDVNGVGYGVRIPLSTYHALSDPPQPIKIFTHLQIQENHIFLYGFATREEKDLFITLLSIPGIGPKTALQILSAIKTGELREAIWSEDVQVLTRVSGIGWKTARRIIFEMKEKIKNEVPEGRIEEDAILALTSLGCSRVEAKKALIQAKSAMGDEYKVEELIKGALKFL